VAKLGEGLDNVVYEVNAELIVRASKEAALDRRSESIRREADLLAAVSELSPLPVPEPIFGDVEAGVLAYFKLPGVPLIDQAVTDPARLTSDLGGFLGRLHRASVQEMEKLVRRDADPLTTWRQEAERDYLKIAKQLPATARRLVEDFLGRVPPAEKRVVAFCHNDLGAEHVLVDAGTNTVTGIIDWTDAAIADPAYDLALIYRDLGPEVFDLTLTHYVGHFDEDDRERVVFYARCSLLEDVVYGLSTPGAHYRYAEAGLAHLARTFA
jgi:aminoglycoside phosphotransferase (APT) family kinase protein